MDIALFQKIKELTDRLFPSNIEIKRITTSYLSPQTVNFTNTVNNATIYNLNEYCSIFVQISGTTEKIKVKPCSKFEVKGSVKSINLYSQFMPCEVLAVGGMNIDYDLPSQKGYLDFRVEQKAVLAVSRKIGYAQENGKLYRSTDSCNTWNEVATAPTNENFNNVLIADNYVIAVTDLGSVFRSDDGVTFTKTTLKVQFTLLWHSMDYFGDTVIIAEYTRSNGNVNVFTSKDKGVTWTTTLTKTAPTEIRHFHSVNYNRNLGKFIVTSGDVNYQVKWWTSIDGLTWTQLNGTDHQRFRTLNVCEHNMDEIIWASDATYEMAEVCKANIEDLTKTTHLTALSGVCWGLFRNGSNLIAITKVEETDKLDGMGRIYISRDNGHTFNCELEYLIRDSNSNGGFTEILGVTQNGEIPIRMGIMDGFTSTQKSVFIKI